MRFDRHDYDPVAGIYDELAAFYSRGRIGATKRSQLDCLKPGDRVLYPGVGRGADAIEAARLGAVVTGIDLSPRMLGRLRRGLDREGLDAELIEGDVSRHRPRAPYDVVAAHYFLNLFDADRARTMLALLDRWQRPGGLLLISDFAPPLGSGLGRLVSEAYYRPVNWIAWALGLCALHPILDYRSLLEPTEFRIVAEQRWPVSRRRNPAYLTIAAERMATPASSDGTFTAIRGSTRR